MASDAFNNQSRTAVLYGGTIPLVVVATSAVALRLYARSLTKARYWWDDGVLVLALMFNYGLSACYWLQVIFGGLGRHSAVVGGPVSEHELFTFYKIFLPLQLFYFTSTFAIKTSLLLLYYRIFAIVSWFRHSLLLAWTIVLFNFLADFLVAIFQCHPVSFFWDKSLPEGGSCINQDQFYRWNGVANLLIDVLILTLTLPMIWNMNLHSRQKLSLTGLFLLGTFACAASVFRVITFNQVHFSDVTYTMVNVSIWSTIEISVGIICACLITYRPLFNRMCNSRTTIATTPIATRPSGTVELSTLRSKASPRFGDASAARFARLSEEEEDRVEHRANIYTTTLMQKHEFPAIDDGLNREHRNQIQ